MYKRIAYSILFLLFFLNTANSQEELKVLRTKKDSLIIDNQGINPLSPARAAFYSAVLPGLGQIYNKKYWKAPIVWAAVGTGTYFYVRNDNSFNRYRTAFKLRQSGRSDEFDGTGDIPFLSEDALIRAQDIFKKNRDLSLFITIGLYALNILEANVDAHLPDKKLNESLSFRPSLFVSPVTNQPIMGVTMNFNF